MSVSETVAAFIAAAEDASNLNAECDAQEKALHDCETVDDWQACLDAFGERVVGSYIADNQDAMATNEHWGEGCAYIQIGASENDQAAYTSWSSDGHYSVEFGSAREARGAIDRANEEWNEAEPDAD